MPQLASDVFVAPGASVIGDVRAEQGVSIWYGTVIRGDVHSISIGARTNLQDLTMVHVTNRTHPTVIGNDVTVGHRVVLHGCTIEGQVLVGMGAIILDGAVVEPYAIVGAGAIVPPGKRVTSGTVVMGAPARVVREVTEQERQSILDSAQRYVEYAARHRTSLLNKSKNGI